MIAGAAARVAGTRDLVARARDLASLGKPRIVALAVLQTAGGLALAAAAVPRLRVAVTLAATALLVYAANAFNQYLERDTDRLMLRTRDRPLPAGRLAASAALGAGLATGALGAALLAGLVNLLTAGLGVLALLWYVLVYTPLKRRTPLALLVGAVPGALPPLMGWTAATGALSAPGFVLFGVLFLWQLPHFLAIATYLQDDYRRAGIRVWPLVHGERATRVATVVSAAALVPVTLLFTPLGVAGNGYLAAALVLGLAFVWQGALGLRRRAGAAWARRYFFASLLYLPALTAALLLDGVMR